MKTKIKIENLDKQIQDFIGKEIDEDSWERIRLVVESEIEKAMKKVKPEFLSKVQWMFEEGFFIRGRNERGEQLIDSAQIIHSFQPKILKFFPDAISFKVYNDLRIWIRQIIKHEMAHIFTTNEATATRWEQEAKVFIEKNDESIDKTEKINNGNPGKN